MCNLGHILEELMKKFVTTYQKLENMNQPLMSLVKNRKRRLLILIFYATIKLSIKMKKEKNVENMEEKAMKLAIEESKANQENHYQKGGPFGAVVVKNGEIITSAHNTVIESKDATAHAEMNAIRQACKILNTNDLSDCILYVNAEPCPMCLSAIIWSNIKEVYYANTRKEAEEIGFRDDAIYEYLSGKNQELLSRHHVERKEAKEVFKIFEKMEEKIMY